MKKTMLSVVSLVSVLSAVVLLASCGGGDDPVAPAYNLDGTWAVAETVTDWGTCEADPTLGAITYSVEVVHIDKSTSATLRDTRSSDPQPAVVNGSLLSYLGPRYNEAPGDCETMTATISANIRSATLLEGTASITCNEWGGGSCTVSTAFYATKPF